MIEHIFLLWFMGKIKILDCTLRDGGYCNNWLFGKDNIKKIITGLSNAKIDIIECGLLINEREYDSDSTRFTEISQLDKIINKQNKNSMYVLLLNYGKYHIEKLLPNNGKKVSGIRVAFHKREIKGALKMCKKIVKKGYKVFLQPMLTSSFSDSELNELIKFANDMCIYAFYIVDSFGSMKNDEVLRIFNVLDNKLKKNINIGFHSHDNMRLAFINAKELAKVYTSRNIIIDATVMGMGRGAGNLRTELILKYLNNDNYNINSILEISEQIIELFYNSNKWGYSILYHWSAVMNIHPDYVNYLLKLKKLSEYDIKNIFLLFDDEKKVIFDKSYIKVLVDKYMSSKS